MVDVIKVLPKIDDQCITIPPMTKIKPSQVLLKPLPGEGYTLALDACPIIMDQVRLEDWTQDTVRQGVLQDHVLDGKCLDKPFPSLLVQDKLVWFSRRVDSIPYNSIQL